MRSDVLVNLIYSKGGREVSSGEVAGGPERNGWGEAGVEELALGRAWCIGTSHPTSHPAGPRGSLCLVLGTSAPSGLAEEVILQKGPAWLPRSKREGRRGRMPLAWAGDYPILFCFQGSRRSLCGKKSCYSPGRHPNARCRRRAELPNSPFRMQRALSCSSYTSGLL